MRKLFVLAVLAVSILQSGCTQEDQELKTVTLNKIIVTRFPASNGGLDWDLGDEPDLLVKISKDGNVLWTNQTFIDNALQGMEYSISAQPPYTFFQPNAKYVLSLHDADGPNSDELMGDVEFVPANAVDGIQILDQGGFVAFRIHVTLNY